MSSTTIQIVVLDEIPTPLLPRLPIFARMNRDNWSPEWFIQHCGNGVWIDDRGLEYTPRHTSYRLISLPDEVHAE